MGSFFLYMPLALIQIIICRLLLLIMLFLIMLKKYIYRYIFNKTILVHSKFHLILKPTYSICNVSIVRDRRLYYLVKVTSWTAVPFELTSGRNRYWENVNKSMRSTNKRHQGIGLIKWWFVSMIRIIIAWQTNPQTGQKKSARTWVFLHISIVPIVRLWRRRRGPLRTTGRCLMMWRR